MKAIARDASRCRRRPCCAIAAGCDGVLDLQRRHRRAGGGARGAGPRGRDGRAAARAGRGRAGAPAARAKERFLAPTACRSVRGCGSGETRSAARRIGPWPSTWRRSPTRWRGSRDAASRARCGRGDRLAVVAPASPFDARGVRARRRRAARARLRAGLRRVACSRGTATSPGRRGCRAAALADAWRDPSIAGAHRRARRLRQRAAPAAARPARLRRRRRRRSSATATSRRCCASARSTAAWSAFHGPMLEGRLGRGADGYDRASFVGAVARPEPLGELAPAGLEALRPGEASGHARWAARLTQLASLAGHAVRVRSAAGRPCCSSTKWASGRIASIAW